MIFWKNVSDSVLFQAHINHLKKISNEDMKDTHTLNKARILRIQAMYERNPELIPGLEEEISQLLD